MIHFGGELQEAEFRRAHSGMVPRPQRWFGISLLAILALALLSGRWRFMLNDPTLNWLLIAWFLAFAIFLIVGPRGAITKIWQNAPLLHQRVDGTISEDGVVWKTPSGQLNLSWDKFIAHRRRADVLLIYTSLNAALILPRSYFANDSDWSAANDLAARKVKAR